LEWRGRITTVRNMSDRLALPSLKYNEVMSIRIGFETFETDESDVTLSCRSVAEALVFRPGRRVQFSNGPK